MALAREHHDELGVASVLSCQGFAMLHGQGPLEPIENLAHQSLALFTGLAVPWGTQLARGLLVQIAMRRGELEKARNLLEQLSEEQQRSTGDDYWTALAHHGLAVILTTQGDRPRARALFVDALKRFDGLGDLGKVAWCLEAVARASDLVQGERAGRLLGAAHALRTQIAVPLPESERPDYDGLVAAVRGTVGASVFDRAWLAGTMLTKEAAIAEAATLVLPADIVP
jgi:tetratricopeptide (TPR) repeat protein